MLSSQKYDGRKGIRQVKWTKENKTIKNNLMKMQRLIRCLKTQDEL